MLDWSRWLFSFFFSATTTLPTYRPKVARIFVLINTVFLNLTFYVFVLINSVLFFTVYVFVLINSVLLSRMILS